MEFETNKKKILERYLSGCQEATDIIKRTFGPNGGVILLSDGRVTKDGPTVASFILDNINNLKNKTPEEIEGIKIICQASKKMEICGDGGTTVTILTTSMMEKVYKWLIYENYNGTRITKAINIGLNIVVEYLQKSSIIIKDKDSIKYIAKVASNGDEKVGDLVSEAFNKTGDKTCIVLKESNTTETELIRYEGYTIDRGYPSKLFLKPEEQKLGVISFENPYILVSYDKIETLMPFQGLLSELYKKGRSIVIFAKEFSQEVIKNCLTNRLLANFNIICVTTSGFGDNNIESTTDLSVVVGAKPIRSNTNISEDNLGSCNLIYISESNTSIVGGKGLDKDIKERGEAIKTQIKNSKSDYEKETLENRLAALFNGLYILYVGAYTKSALEELKDRYQDAIGACNSALKLGIGPGSGVDLLKALKHLIIESNKYIDIKEIMIDIYTHVLTSVTSELIKSSEVSRDIYLNELNNRLDKEPNLVYNVKTKTIEDSKVSGILNPTLISIESLKIATEIIGIYTNTAGSILEKLDKQDKQDLS